MRTPNNLKSLAGVTSPLQSRSLLNYLHCGLFAAVRQSSRCYVLISNVTQSNPLRTGALRKIALHVPAAHSEGVVSAHRSKWRCARPEPFGFITGLALALLFQVTADAAPVETPPDSVALGSLACDPDPTTVNVQHYKAPAAVKSYRETASPKRKAHASRPLATKRSRRSSAHHHKSGKRTSLKSATLSCKLSLGAGNIDFAAIDLPEIPVAGSVGVDDDQSGMQSVCLGPNCVLAPELRLTTDAPLLATAATGGANESVRPTTAHAVPEAADSTPFFLTLVGMWRKRRRSTRR